MENQLEHEMKIWEYMGAILLFAPLQRQDLDRERRDEKLKDVRQEGLAVACLQAFFA